MDVVAFLVFLGCFVLYGVNKERKTNKDLKELRAFATQLDGTLLADPRRKIIEIPSFPDGPILFEYRTWFHGKYAPIPYTVVSIPVHLSKSVRFDLVGEPSSQVLGGYGLTRVLTHASLFEDQFHRVEEAVDTGDPEFENEYRTHTNRAEDVKAVLARLKPLILSSPVGSFRLDLPKDWAKSRDHTMSGIFWGHIRNVEKAQRVILVTSALAAAIREQMTVRPNLTGAFPNSNVTRSSLKIPDGNV